MCLNGSHLDTHMWTKNHEHLQEKQQPVKVEDRRLGPQPPVPCASRSPALICETGAGPDLLPGPGQGHSVTAPGAPPPSNRDRHPFPALVKSQGAYFNFDRCCRLSFKTWLKHKKASVFCPKVGMGKLRVNTRKERVGSAQLKWAPLRSLEWAQCPPKWGLWPQSLGVFSFPQSSAPLLPNRNVAQHHKECHCQLC